MSELNSNTGALSAAGTPGGEPRTVDAGRGWNWIADGWELFKKNPGVWIVNLILFVVIYMLLNFVPIIGHIATYLVAPVMMGGLMLGCRALDRGEKFEVEHLFAGFKTNTSQLVMLGVFNLIILLLIFCVAAVAVLLAGGGAIFAAIAGEGLTGALLGGALMVFMLIGALVVVLLAIPLVMAQWFAPCLVVLRNMAATDAMVTSFNACLKNMIPFLVYGVIGLILGVAASIPALLGWLVLIPVFIASVYTGYRDIFAES
jgi:uncharacterized membrane protein